MFIRFRLANGIDVNAKNVFYNHQRELWKNLGRISDLAFFL